MFKKLSSNSAMCILLLIMFFSAMSLSGCTTSQQSTEVSTEDQVVRTTAQETVLTEVSTEASNETAEVTESNLITKTSLELEVPDPYSYLSLIAGNADELTFEYVSTNPETQTSFLGQFFKFDGIAGERFETVDHEGEIITITELERSDGVYYVDDHKQKVYHFTELADDLMLYKLLGIVAYEPVKILDATEGKYYIYDIPFDQDITISYHYELLMTPNGLKSLDTFLDDHYVNSTTFMEFLNVKSDPGLLLMPESYTLEEYDYNIHAMNIPPWW